MLKIKEKQKEWCNNRTNYMICVEYFSFRWKNTSPWNGETSIIFHSYLNLKKSFWMEKEDCVKMFPFSQRMKDSISWSAAWKVLYLLDDVNDEAIFFFFPTTRRLISRRKRRNPFLLLYANKRNNLAVLQKSDIISKIIASILRKNNIYFAYWTI